MTYYNLTHNNIYKINVGITTNVVRIELNQPYDRFNL